MASETPLQPVNGGSYGAMPHYNAAELPAPNPPPGAGANGVTAGAAQAHGQASTTEVSENGPSKNEVGWFFVEQYYTTMSRSPEKLHLFYNKKSQFVSGLETVLMSVSVGQKAIGERIKEMGIENCKVRVTNVDSQESHDKSIVIQVIGEMSNKNEPHKKFVETFVLAKQANGYYVLNDIFRFMAEDEEEEAEPEPAAPEANAAPVAEPEITTLTSSDDPVDQAKDAEIVDHKLEKSAGEQPAALSVTPAIPQVAIPGNLAGATSQTAALPKAAPEPVPISPEVEETEPEKPKDPEPSPAPSSPQPEESSPVATKEQPTEPSKPAAPKTWASMLAGGAGKVAAPAAPATGAATVAPNPKKTLVPGAAAAASAAAAAAAVAPVPASSNATSTQPTDEQALPSPGGWQTAGQDYGRKANRGANPTSNVREGAIKAYVKNVTERVDGPALRTALAKYGKIDYFDVSRQKSCAFVEFADQAGFNAAVAANPHNIGGEEIFVDERIMRPQSYGQGGFAPRGGRGGMRGGPGGMDGRNNSPGGNGRGGFKDGRGGYPPRGRGGMASRGRGMPQAA